MYKVLQTQTFSDGSKNAIVILKEFATIDDAQNYICYSLMDEAWDYFTNEMSPSEITKLCPYFNIRDKEVSDMTFENTATRETFHWDIFEATEQPLEDERKEVIK